MANRDLSRRLSSWWSRPDLVSKFDAVPSDTPRAVCATLVVVRIVNFAEVSEASHLDRLREVLHAYFCGLEQAVRSHRGSIDSLLGMRAMLSFGALQRSDSAPADALRAVGRLLRSERDSLRMRLASVHPCLDLAVGVGTGETLCGSIDAETQSFNSCFGGAAERALALCDLAKGGELVVDAATLSEAGMEPPGEPLGQSLNGLPLYRLSSPQLVLLIGSRPVGSAR